MARLADLACDGVDDPHNAGLRTERLAKQANPQIEAAAAKALFTTFMYLIQVASPDEPPDARLDPLDGPSLFPLALREADGDLRQLWLGLAGEVRHPVARARCWDIVFTLQLMPNRRDAAERAVRAYLDSTSTPLSLQEKANGLLRAWTMARLVRLTDIEQEIATAMTAVVEAAVDQREHPYAAITVLGALTAPPPGRAARVANPAVDDLLDRALTTYPQVHIIQGFAALVRKSAGSGSVRVEHANRHEVEAMIAEAEAATDPMIIRTRFSDAASAARRYGVADLERVAVARLQAAPPVTWERTEWSFVTPKAFFDLYLPGFSTATDWRRALSIWLHSGPPSGNKETNEATARQAMGESIIRFLATTVLFRDGDLPSRTVTGDAAAFDRELVRAEQHSLNMNGRFLARALWQIRERFGVPSHDDLTEFLRLSNADPAMVHDLATALQLYWIDEYDASSHLVVPKVEAAARALLLELNEPMYRTAIGDKAGQFPGLGVLLPFLVDNTFDPDWERFLRTFLLSDGANIRNLIAHGFARNISAIEAALALRAAAVLILLTTNRAVTRDAETIRAAVAAPVCGPRRPWRQRLVAALWAAGRELHN
ncbi:hypothetical protein JOD64_005251 [Micromonospora luteifusca]|uniref:DUF7380 domain-containing protein n=1 Tax=Micromonospora luteifusca TaxID=709860 RepID=A0ABS2M288_9ACTN|nr:hypothetical protein [Micromonospora luteifusca]MBM7494029.1 hypothetical protein [Micromonospora luteifusca]